MRIIIYNVNCDYETGRYHIVTENNAFKDLNCICENPTELIKKTFSITKDTRKRGYLATFVYSD